MMENERKERKYGPQPIGEFGDFLPSIVLDSLCLAEQNSIESKGRHCKNREAKEVDMLHTIDAAVLFVDISGFLKLSESFSSLDRRGTILLAENLNKCFTKLISAVAPFQGDIFKFCGDGIIAVWPAFRFSGSIEHAIFNATQSAVSMLQADISPFEVKIGIGSGKMDIVYVSAPVFNIADYRSSFVHNDYIAVGEALSNAFKAERLSSPNQIVLAGNCVRTSRMRESFQLKPIVEAETDEPFYSVCLGNDSDKIPFKKFPRSQKRLRKYSKSLHSTVVESFLPVQVRTISNRQLLRTNSTTCDETGINGLKNVTCAFVGLHNCFTKTYLPGERSKSISVARMINDCFSIIRPIVALHGGTVNKLCVDEKGVALLIVFDLPATQKEDGSDRAVNACVQVWKTVKSNVSVDLSIGISTGEAYCGIVGDMNSRKEYTVIGECVNVASRLMHMAKFSASHIRTNFGVGHEDLNISLRKPNKCGDSKLSLLSPVKILTDHKTYRLAENDRLFNKDSCLTFVRVKGKIDPLEVHEIKKLSVAAESKNILSNCKERFIIGNSLRGTLSEPKNFNRSKYALLGRKLEDDCARGSSISFNDMETKQCDDGDGALNLSQLGTSLPTAHFGLL